MIDVFASESPKASLNFLKLCALKYYNDYGLLRAEISRCKAGIRRIRGRRSVDILHVREEEDGGESEEGFADEIVKRRGTKRRRVKHDQMERVPDYGKKIPTIAVFNHDERFRPRFRWETYHFWTRRGFRRVAAANEAYCDEMDGRGKIFGLSTR